MACALRSKSVIHLVLSRRASQLNLPSPICRSRNEGWKAHNFDVSVSQRDSVGAWKPIFRTILRVSSMLKLFRCYINSTEKYACRSPSVNWYEDLPFPLCTLHHFNCCLMTGRSIITTKPHRPPRIHAPIPLTSSFRHVVTFQTYLSAHLDTNSRVNGPSKSRQSGPKVSTSHPSLAFSIACTTLSFLRCHPTVSRRYPRYADGPRPIHRLVSE